MNNSIEEILSILVIKIAEHFGLEYQDAIAAVAQSKTAEELRKYGNNANLSIDEICSQLYKEISSPK